MGMLHGLPHLAEARDVEQRDSRPDIEHPGECGQEQQAVCPCPDVAVGEDPHRLPLSGACVPKTLGGRRPGAADSALGPVPAVRLRLVESLVGGAEQLFHRVFRSIVATPQLALVFMSPTACASIVRRSRSAKRCAPARSVSGRMTTNSSPPQRATVSPCPRERGEEPADRPQHHVAGGVTERVVDLLEAVEVEQHDGELVGEAVGAGDLGGEDLLECAPVREPGERVDPRLARLLLRPAEGPQQGTGEHEREQHERREREQAGLGDAEVGGVLPVLLDRARR